MVKIMFNGNLFFAHRSNGAYDEWILLHHHLLPMSGANVADFFSKVAWLAYDGDQLRQYVLMPGKVHANDIPVPVHPNRLTVGRRL